MKNWGTVSDDFREKEIDRTTMINANSRTGHIVVFGAGTMGSGIAALMASAGWRVTLLDKDNLAQIAIDKSVKGGVFFLPEQAQRIKPGNVETDLEGAVKDADWVLEAIIEQVDAKRALWSEVVAHAHPSALLSSNTSGLGIEEMSSHLSPAARKRFIGTHFFNPPRPMRLLEVIPTDQTDPALVEGFNAFAEQRLGKRVVIAKDRPGFITTRIGVLSMMIALNSAIRHGIQPEEADLLLGPLSGRPRSGVFRLADLVGLDISHNILLNQQARLQDDIFVQSLQMPPLWQTLVDSGRLGEKTGAGFYKREGKQIFTLDFVTGDYRPKIEPQLPIDATLAKAPLGDRLITLLGLPDPYGAFMREAFLTPIFYAAWIASEVAYDLPSIDQAMELGFNWQTGPFATLDLLKAAGADLAVSPLSGLTEDEKSAETVSQAIHALLSAATPGFYAVKEGKRYALQMSNEGGIHVELPVRADRISLSELAESGKTVMETEDLRAIDIGDGALCLELRTKAAVLTPRLMQSAFEVIERAEQEFKALVIGNQGNMYSAGFNLKLFLEYIDNNSWNHMEGGLDLLQRLSMRMKYAQVPVVAAVHGYALGGGCEIMLPCACVHAHVESGIGLPEALVGLLPAGGGTTIMTGRATANLQPDEDPLPRLKAYFQTLAMGKRSNNAFEAKRMGFLRECENLCWNIDRLLFEAKTLALALAEAGYQPPPKPQILALGEGGYARLMLEVDWMRSAGQISDHDHLIASKIAGIMTGGNMKSAALVSEDYLHELEREAFVFLCGTEASRARIQAMLETGKPLRN